MIHVNIQNSILDVALSIKKGEFVALTGESGSGKTTLLRSLAGLENATGEITVFETTFLDSNKNLPTQKRNIGFVFQDYALFENMTVMQNLLYVEKDQKLAEHLLSMTELLELKDRYPHSLSGGQQQRVSLCRAFMSRPQLLLMDEPLSALHPDMREQLQHDILKLHQEFAMTTIMVSHSPSEVYKLANRVLVMQKGKITQDKTPKEVFLKTKGSQKFSLQGKLLDIIQADVIHIAVVAIGQQIVEIVIDSHEAKTLKTGQKVLISTKAFSPTITPLTAFVSHTQ